MMNDDFFRVQISEFNPHVFIVDSFPFTNSVHFAEEPVKIFYLRILHFAPPVFGLFCLKNQ